MNDLVIDPEFFAYLPRHGAEEHARLEEKLLAEGCRDPIRVWKGHNIIVDGHERYGICKKHNLPFEVLPMPFEDREAVKTWMSLHLIAGRNTTKQQFDYHLGRYYNSKKEKRGG